MSNPIEKIKKDSNFKKYLFSLIILSLLIGIWIVPLEAGHKINSVEDGLWWAITTITGVGYGDLVPVTTAGRVAGAILMTAGLILFSLVVAILTSNINNREEKYRAKRFKLQLDSINNKLYRLEHKLEYLIKEDKGKLNS